MRNMFFISFLHFQQVNKGGKQHFYTEILKHIPIWYPCCDPQS